MTLFNKRTLYAFVLAPIALAISAFLTVGSAQSPPTGQCLFNYRTNTCQIQGGNFCAAGFGVGSTCQNAENACCCVLPAYTLTVGPWNASVILQGQSTSATVTVIPAPGASGQIGQVQLSSSSGTLPCSMNPNPVSSIATPAISTLTCTPSGTTPIGNYTVTVTAADASQCLSGYAPSNGPQSVTLQVGQLTACVGDCGGGDVALLTFLGLLAMWISWSMRHRVAGWFR